jgi:hypothetical protein
MKVGLCVPTRDVIADGFSLDWARLAYNFARNHPDYELAQYKHPGTLISDQRIALCDHAIKSDCDRVLFFDSDMRFPADTFDRLEAHGKPFVASNYTTRRPPFQAVASRSSKGPWTPVNTRAESTGLEAVSAVGLGISLIHTDLLKKLPKPWFLVGYHMDIHQSYGEDVWFCRLLGAHGIEVLIDHDLSKEVKHIGMKEYTFADVPEESHGDN